ncbi:hypothetical protein ACFQ4C_30075 [Larkinella insperata]|uniref:Uncharacterized protein n=1 Tax=Larkinella insperata TaxID=332158 RepID=A0ABW3QCL1_9BACT
MTLFYDSNFPSYTKGGFERKYGLIVSDEFLQCAEKQLRKDFITKTGLKPGRHVSTALPSELTYIIGQVSSISYLIYIAHNWNPVKICWQSKSGTIYGLTDPQIQCDDLLFWFEGLNPIEYHKQLHPNEKLPFQLKNLRIELVVERLMLDPTICIHFTREDPILRAAIIQQVDMLVCKWNKKGDKDQSDHSQGVIHNWRVESEDKNELILTFDLGSADIKVLKKLVELFNAQESIQKVIIG